MLYIFYGSDSFSRREAVDALKRELDPDGTLSTNTIEFDARETTPAEVLAACDTVPFFGGHRLVILEGALGQGQAGRGRVRRRKHAQSEEDQGVAKGPWWALVEYVQRMPQETVLVLVEGDRVDHVLLEALAPLATVQRFALPAPKGIAAWVQARARLRGLKIDGRACAALAERVGNDTWTLASEIEKLAAYAAGETVREQDVIALVSDVRDREGYLLADAVADGKAAAATRLLHQMLAKGRPSAVLLLTIQNRYRRIAAAREMVDAGESGGRIGMRLGVTNQFALERLLEQASRHSMSRARWALDRMAQSDYDVKQGLEDEQLSLELLVQELTSSDSAWRAA
jgi:DNA polymerase-3 subunit delta